MAGADSIQTYKHQDSVGSASDLVSGGMSGHARKGSAASNQSYESTGMSSAHSGEALLPDVGYQGGGPGGGKGGGK